MSRRTPSHHVVSPIDSPLAGARTADRDLCLCRHCACTMVEPTAWSAAGPESWSVTLRCPNCEHTSEGVFSQECVDRFDERLDAATTAMVADLKRLEAANMADDVERFIGALNAGAILPEDFAAAEEAR